MKSLEDKPSKMIRKVIIDQIVSGELLPGDKLYSERAMANMYGVSRMAVQYAMIALEKEGYVERVRGSGTYVKRLKYDKMDIGYFSSESGNAGLTALLKSYGADFSNKVLMKGIITGNYFSNKLGLEKGSRIFALHRIRYSNGEPFAVEYAYIPADKFEGIENIDFANVSLYDFMGSKGKMPKHFDEKMQIVQVSERERGYLELDQDEPVYYLEYVSVDESGDIVEYTESFARCDKVSVTFKTTAR